VRSIQSVDAQPDPKASAAAMSTPAMIFIRPRLGVITDAANPGERRTRRDAERPRDYP
jgi:hypothetical protein